MPSSRQARSKARLWNSGPLSTCSVSGSPATGQGAAIPRSDSHPPLSYTACKRHRPTDTRDGASSDKWKPVTTRVRTSTANVIQGSADRLSVLFVHDDHVNLGVIDLHYFQRTMRRIFARCWLGRVDRLVVAAPKRPDPRLNQKQSRSDRAPGGWCKTFLATAQPDLFDDPAERRAAGFQIIAFDDLPDQRLLLRCQELAALLTPPPTRDQHRDCPARPIALGSEAEPELPLKIIDRAH